MKSKYYLHRNGKFEEVEEWQYNSHFHEGKWKSLARAVYSRLKYSVYVLHF